MSSVEAHLPLRPRVFAILAALRRAPAHGYGLLRALEDASPSLAMDPGLMYRTIARLCERGLVTERERPEGADARRRYYELTPLGQEAVRRDAERQAAVLRTVDLETRS